MKILVVDDDKSNRESIVKYLQTDGFEAIGADNAFAAQRKLTGEVFTAAIVDLKMPDMNGLELLCWLRDEGPQLPVIMISAFGEISDAVEAMKLGAKDYVVKPFDPEELVLRLQRIIEEQAAKTQVEAGTQNASAGTGTLGKAKVTQNIARLIEKIAATPSTVLVTGDSGTGKEVVARRIHSHSDRSDGPFVPVNVAGIPETLLESELFGYEKGAFTGATGRKIGMFELASSGTLFLDEIGEMLPSLQAKLLRVLQDRCIRRLGGTQTVPIDTRIIAATNRDLEKSIEEGRFREDLYYRLNVVNIHMPPLRERVEDVPFLVGQFIEQLNKRMGKSITGISPHAMAGLMRYPFPGNVRELENMIERAFIFAEGQTIELMDLTIPDSSDKPAGKPAPSTIKEAERVAIVEALRRWEGNRSKAAQELGIARRTLIYKIKEYGVKA